MALPFQAVSPLEPCAHCDYGLIGRTVYVVGEPERGREAQVFIGRL